MTMTSIGDLAQLFTSTRSTSRIKTQMNALTQELSTGIVADVGRHLGADSSALAAIDRSIAMSDRYAAAASSAGQTLSVMQTALDLVEASRSETAAALVSISQSSTTSDQEFAAQSARAALETAVQGLNTTYADQSLFGGAAVSDAALRSVDDILSSVRTVIDGATDVETLKSAMDDWLNGGGYETDIYNGDTEHSAARPIGVGQSVSFSVRADDDAIKTIISGLAVSALSTGLGLDSDAVAELQNYSGEMLLSAGDDLARAQGELGIQEEKVANASARLAADTANLQIRRNEMVASDSYEAAVALQQIQTQLQTHYTLTAKLSGLSLTEYL